MAYDLVDLTAEHGHYQLTLANPDKPNPINERLQGELHAVLDTVEDDDDATVLTVTGENGSFAVGADVSQMHTWFEREEYDRLMQFLRDGQRLMSRFADLEIVTVAGINGYALGGGLELALACDVRFAGASAQVGFPEIDLGMIPGWGGTQRLPEVVGESTAKDLLVTGRHLEAEEAFELGLVDRVVPDEELDPELDQYAETLGEKPAHTLRYLLDAVETGGKGPIETGLGYELMCDMFASFDDETAARVADFAEE